MRKSYLFLFLTLLCSFTVLTTQLIAAEETIDVPYENQQIERIEIEAGYVPEDSVFDSKSVLTRLKTQEGDFFSHSTFDNDLKTLSQDFDRLEPVVHSVNGKIHIKIILWPRPTIRSIWLTGNKSIAKKDLEDELDVKIGSVFDRQAFNKAFHKLKAYYVKKGFFEAEVEYRVTPDPMCNAVDIEITATEGRCGKIKEISFENFTCEEQADLIEKITTKEWNIFSWMSGDGIYHEEMIQRDQFVVLNYLQDCGYADAVVDITVTEADCDDRIVIHIAAIKGEVYHFGKVAIEGNTLYCKADILRQFTFGTGSCYSPDAIRITVDNITNLYGRRGYIDAVIDYEPILNEECKVYDIHITIDEGEQYRVGLIKVFGNCQTQTNTILNETLLIPGEVFNLDKLRATESRLRNVGFFSTVNVYAVRASDCSTADDNYRDVHIEVEEQNTGSLGLSLGLSTAENFFGSINITEKNFNYQGMEHVGSRGFSAIRGAGEYTRLNATIGTKSRSYSFAWAKPYFMDTCWSVGFELENSNIRYISNDYSITSSKARLFASYDINAFLRYGCHYRLQNSLVELNNPAKATPSLRRQEKNSGIISAAGMSISYDSTNHPVRPNDGLRSSLLVEYAGLGGFRSFASAGYVNTAYHKLGDCGIMKYRADLRFIQPTGTTRPETVPLDERLFLGGDSNVRGYRPYAIGPKFPGSDDPQGGVSLFLFSAEYSRPLMSRAEFFAFFDAGQLSLNPWDFSNNLKGAVGFGLRLAILPSMPPLTIGMGFPINPNSRSDVKRFFFNLGGTF
jgi:outer membrane protein insertion porin family